MTYVPREIKAELDATGLPWSVDPGGKHLKIMLNGSMVGVLSYGRTRDGWHAIKRVSAKIRRAANR